MSLTPPGRNILKRRVNGVLVEWLVDGVAQPLSVGRDSVEVEPIPAAVAPPEPKPIEPQPWPVALLPLKLLRQPTDRGAGDIIARVIGPIGGDAFKAWYKKILGGDCGCNARQADWNARWPLDVESAG
jgi:hypothetical protein